MIKVDSRYFSLFFKLPPFPGTVLLKLREFKHFCRFKLFAGELKSSFDPAVRARFYSIKRFKKWRARRYLNSNRQAKKTHRKYLHTVVSWDCRNKLDFFNTLNRRCIFSSRPLRLIPGRAYLRRNPRSCLSRPLPTRRAPAPRRP